MQSLIYDKITNDELYMLWLYEWNKYWLRFPKISPENYYQPMGLKQLLAPSTQDIILQYLINTDNCPINPIKLLMITESNKFFNFKFCIDKIKVNDLVFQTWLLQKLDKDVMRVAKPLPFVAAMLNLPVRETHIIIIAAKISNPSKFKVYESLNELPRVCCHDFEVTSLEMRNKLYNNEEKIRERSLKDNLWPFVSCENK